MIELLNMILIFDENYMPHKTLSDKMTQVSEECVKAAGLDPDNIEISVTFLSAEEIMELNAMHRNVHKPTDVLSFPQYESLAEIKAPDGQPVTLGDVVIAPDVAFVQAAEYGHTPLREIIYLFAHGVLHLMGFDHMTDEDKSVMRRMEEDILQKVGITR